MSENSCSPQSSEGNKTFSVETRKKEPFDCVAIVLGQVIPKDPTEKPFVRDPREQDFFNKDGTTEVPNIWLSPDALLRAYAAGLLWESGHASGVKTLLLISGGATGGSEKPSEALAIKQLIRVMFPHIPEDEIMLEDQSFNSIENARNTHKILADLREKIRLSSDCPIWLVSSGYHLERAQRIFKRTGIKTVPVVETDVIKSSFISETKDRNEGKLSGPVIKKIKRNQTLNFAAEMFNSLWDQIDPDSKITSSISKFFRGRPKK